ncbi:SUMF1/EgtB/PvdO family nonheme iron enzyme [Haloferula sp. A504]|uniref:SUMF1/EgtB/PvdO family nonheme iron enzyme n=1 Tax=Haloferula sp. A504 TaxID=3373601 RepID=UPI0031BE01E9|nr:SUMF1/EgtB/PvdO family nonheme iron enzyme [Verrucomicrobiaceae bacterium E54]
MNVDQHDYPAGHISKDEAENFCRALSEYTGQDVRLPTEAEWEYAARAGTDTLWFFGDDPAPLGDYAWYEPNAGGKPHPVGRKKPNPWGFHDMYGNLWECVSDAYHRDYFANSPKKDPIGNQQPSEYTMDYTIRASKAGRYVLTAEVVTANYWQNIALRVNGSTDEQLITLPMTLGDWQNTPETVVELKAGENQLKFLRRNPIQYAVAIRSFTLRPIQ